MARKRRSRGEGSIFKRGRDGKWVVEIILGPKADGSSRVLRHTADTRAEAVDWRTARNAERKAGTLASPTNQTVGGFIEAWLRDSQAGIVAPKTYESRMGLMRRYVIPALGHVPLVDLTPQDIQGLLARLRESGLTRTGELVYDTLRLVLGQATRWGLVPRNAIGVPGDKPLVDRPKFQRREMLFLGPDAAREFLATARGDRFEALFVLALSIGCRQGELLGLQWPDIDFSAGTVRIVRTLQSVPGGGFRFNSPKTRRSRRAIDLPDIALQALREHRDRQEAERAALGEPWDESGLVFTTRAWTPLAATNLCHHSFKPILRRAGLPSIPFHSLRHSCAVLHLSAGTDPLVVADLLGHSRVGFTLERYGHVVPGLRRIAADRMNDLLPAQNRLTTDKVLTLAFPVAGNDEAERG